MSLFSGDSFVSEDRASLPGEYHLYGVGVWDGARSQHDCCLYLVDES
jgi:hypothetical protein